MNYHCCFFRGSRSCYGCGSVSSGDLWDSCGRRWLPKHIHYDSTPALLIHIKLSIYHLTNPRPKQAFVPFEAIPAHPKKRSLQLFTSPSFLSDKYLQNARPHSLRCLKSGGDYLDLPAVLRGQFGSRAQLRKRRCSDRHLPPGSCAELPHGPG